MRWIGEAMNTRNFFLPTFISSMYASTNFNWAGHDVTCDVKQAQACSAAIWILEEEVVENNSWRHAWIIRRVFFNCTTVKGNLFACFWIRKMFFLHENYNVLMLCTFGSFNRIYITYDYILVCAGKWIYLCLFLLLIIPWTYY